MKRIRVVLLVLLLILLSCICSYAASTTEVQCADALYELGLFKGTGVKADGSPEYSLDIAPTRAEAITMLVRLLGKESEAKSQEWETPFTDVEDWAKPYVGYAYNNGLTTGTGATTFGGSEKASETQYLTFVLRALGYSDKNGDFKWDEAKKITNELGITQDSTDKSFHRSDIAQISYNALKAKMSSNDAPLISSLISQCVTTDKEWDAVSTLMDSIQSAEYQTKVKSLDGRVFARGNVGESGYKSVFAINCDFPEYLDVYNEILFNDNKNNTANTGNLRDGFIKEKLVDKNVWRVSASVLGKTRYSNKQIEIMVNASPEFKQAMISNLYEAIQLYQISGFEAVHDNIDVGDWEFSKPGYYAVKSNCGCCATSANWLYYILKDDYDELGMIHYSDVDTGGHVFNYIKDDGYYYIIDMTCFRYENNEMAEDAPNIGVDFRQSYIYKSQTLEDFLNYSIKYYCEVPVLFSTYANHEVIAMCGNRQLFDTMGVTEIIYDASVENDVRILYIDKTKDVRVLFEKNTNTIPDWSKVEGLPFNIVNSFTHIKLNVDGSLVYRTAGFGRGNNEFIVYVIDRNGNQTSDFKYSIENSIGDVSRLSDGGLKLKANKKGECIITITADGETASFCWHNSIYDNN